MAMKSWGLGSNPKMASWIGRRGLAVSDSARANTAQAGAGLRCESMRWMMEKAQPSRSYLTLIGYAPLPEPLGVGDPVLHPNLINIPGRALTLEMTVRQTPRQP